MVYDQDALQRIEDAIGPCDRRGELLEHIERAAQDYLTDQDSPPAPPAAVRGQLRELASAVRAAHRAFDGLDLGSDLHLAWTASQRDFKLPDRDYLECLADVADAAANMPVVKHGERPSAFNDFIGALARIVEHFAGWRMRTPTHARVFVPAPDDVREELLGLHERDESRYGGMSLSLVKACAEPLGIKKNDPALARAIGRALERTS